MTEVSNKRCTLFEGSRVRSRILIKGRLFEGCIGLQRDYFGVLCSKGRLLRENPTLTNLRNNHEITSQEYISMGHWYEVIGTRSFGETQTKVTGAYAQS